MLPVLLSSLESSCHGWGSVSQDPVRHLLATPAKKTLPTAGAVQGPGRSLGNTASQVSFSHTFQRAERAFHFWYKTFWVCLLTKTSFVPADSDLTEGPWIAQQLGLCFTFPSWCICPIVSSVLFQRCPGIVSLLVTTGPFLLCLERRQKSKCAKHLTASQWYKLHRREVSIVKRSDSFKVSGWLSSC